MSRKILTALTLAGILGSTAACADVTGPQQNQQQSGFCAVTGGGQTCNN